MDYAKTIEVIDEHLQKDSKKFYFEYYVGITDDIERRLFTEHKVPKENHWYIWVKTDDPSIARKVEDHYLKLGMEGDKGGGNDKSIYVYCYSIAQFTVE